MQGVFADGEKSKIEYWLDDKKFWIYWNLWGNRNNLDLRLQVVGRDSDDIWLIDRSSDAKIVYTIYQLAIYSVWALRLM